MSEANALKRQSAIVLSSITEQQQLAEALAEMETLNNKMAEMQKEKNNKIATLEAEVEMLKESVLLEENRSKENHEI